MGKKELAATAAQAKRTNSSNTVASGTVRRKRRTLDQVRSEGYDCAVRHCVEALLNDGNFRDYIAGVFWCNEIVFPSTDTPDWNGLFAFDDWDDWVAIKQF